MKLKNKETGKIRNFEFVAISKDMDAEFAKYAHNAPVLICRSIDQLNEEWEDYRPKEPLFTKEAARIMRDWAELNGLEKERFRCQCINDETITFIIWKMPDARGFQFDVPKTHASMKITVGTEYTIDELCGEEEE